MLHELNHIHTLTNTGTFTQVSCSGPWVKAKAVQTINFSAVFLVHRDTGYPKSSLNLCQYAKPLTCNVSCTMQLCCLMWSHLSLSTTHKSHASYWTLSFHIKFSTRTHWIKVYKIGGEMYKHILYTFHQISHNVTSCVIAIHYWNEEIDIDKIHTFYSGFTTLTCTNFMSKVLTLINVQISVITTIIIMNC